MKEFLSYIYNKNYTKSEIYQSLETYGISDNRDTKVFFDYFKDVFNNDNTFCFSSGYWLVISSLECISNKEYIKLYIPLKYDSIKDGVEGTIKLLENENIPHNSKLAPDMRSDNFVVRLDSNERNFAFYLIDYINDRYELNNVNPFIPKYKNIGIMKDNGYSYNSEISLIINEYIFYCKHMKYNEVDLNGLKEYVDYLYRENLCNKYTYNTFNSAYNQNTLKLKR